MSIGKIRRFATPSAHFDSFRPPRLLRRATRPSARRLAMHRARHAVRLTTRARTSLSSAAAPTGKLALQPAGRRPDFTDPRLAFAQTSTPELLRGAAVLTACSQQWLVRRCERLLALSNRVVGERATQAVLRHSIFAHFVAGECEATIAPKLQRLRAQGVGGILDYAAEAKLEADGAAPLLVTNQPARVYPYAGEEECDANLRIFLSAVRAVHATTPDGFAAIKVTALGDPKLLERVSSAVLALRAFYETLDCGRGQLTCAQFVEGWTQAFDVTAEEAAELFERFDNNKDGSLDSLEFTNSLALEEVPELVLRCRSKGPLFVSALSPDEMGAFSNMMSRLDTIAELACQLGVRLMVDAEHTYFQPCIDHAVLRLQRKYNKEYPAVFGTYQAYLVDCNSTLQIDLERARREGFHLGAKLVRGAYMVHERERAKKRGYPDPIQPTVQATHDSYNRAVEAILVNAPCPDKTSLVLATHNQQSVELAVDKILKDQSCISRDRIYFAQLYGMADHLTFTLAAEGFKSYKYVPYGPVSEVLPYLIRRAQESENSDALSGASQQRAMMLREVRYRWIGF
ncbi:hypothetical protein AB1Y20_000942 [Prymnesium parvum]|uniref:Proline dehydrogenase n=1 Tax=Prymnesium parvum TaxID=97485 RepID=A0AB34K9G9_PRYPA